MNNPLYFKQLEIGPMQNYIYLIGSTETRKVAVVDAAWEIDTIVKIAAQDEMEITHALVTHTHPDHVGGGFAGMAIDGATELLEKCKAKVVVHKAEAEFIKGLSAPDMIKTDNGDKIDVGGIEIQLMHTPGHTPGSQCFLVDGRVISGDTMFIDACGRVDFPDYSLTQKLMALPEDTVLYPGHNYAPLKHATIGQQKKTNPYLRFPSLKQFLAAMGYR
jgi:glyoxylase-like metal-dependent hydrolase (beta-lactamase superfamily II)